MGSGGDCSGGAGERRGGGKVGEDEGMNGELPECLFMLNVQ